MRVYAVIHADSAAEYWAEVPALPGLRVRARNRQELTTSLRQAIEARLIQRDGALPPDGLELQEGEEIGDLIARLETGGPLSPA